MLDYLCVLLIVQSCSSTALEGMLGYLCVLLMVKAAVLLLSWDVRLPLCIVDGPKLQYYCSRGMLGYLCVLLMVKSCSSTALVGC